MGDIGDEIKDLRGLHGLTWHERKTAERFARVLVSCGDLDELLRQFGNCINNECKRAGINAHDVFAAVRDEMADRFGPSPVGDLPARYDDDG